MIKKTKKKTPPIDNPQTNRYYNVLLQYLLLLSYIKSLQVPSLVKDTQFRLKAIKSLNKLNNLNFYFQPTSLLFRSYRLTLVHGCALI